MPPHTRQKNRPSANGSISGTTPQTVDYGNDGTLVTAVPATGYHFVSWSDGVLTAGRTDLTVTFIGDKRVLADVDALARHGYGEDAFGNNVLLPRELSYLRR